MHGFAAEIESHLKEKLIPFWEGLRDSRHGGYYGYMDFDLQVEQEAEKGCILNSRILWFFSNAYRLLGEEHLKEHADHAYRFFRDCCLDREYGGVYWSLTFDGKPLDTIKHTYNQAFAIYALSSYYDATGCQEALAWAGELWELVEGRCRDGGGYLEAFNRDFTPAANDKLSENGVLAERTMNTLLHVLEAYTEYYRVLKKVEAADGCRKEPGAVGAGECQEMPGAGAAGGCQDVPEARVADGCRKVPGAGGAGVSGRSGAVADALRGILDQLAEKIYNPAAGRQEVFFDRDWHSLIDLYSYGHDIETAWLVDRTLDILGDETCSRRLAPVTREITANIYKRAYRDHSLLEEAENGIDKTTRVWWIQAETVVGFINGWQRQGDEKYLVAAKDVWNYIVTYLVDPRPGSEWFWCVDENHEPVKKPVVEPWKCPYHNGRMCMEVIRRLCDQAGQDIFCNNKE